ncbi:MAG: c-type cytochrome [Flavobacterium sp.]
MYLGFSKIWLLLVALLSLDKTEEQTTPLKASMDRGAIVYEEFCMQCHLGDGKGTKGVVPPLAKSDWLFNKRKESIHAIKFGQSGKIVVNGINYDSQMPNMNLTDQEVADVMNYILNSWGNQSKKIVTEQEVKAVLK